MSKSEKQEGAAAEAKPKKKSKLLVLGIPVFMLLMGGGAGAWWYLKGQTPPAEGEAAEEATHEPEEAEGGLLELAPFVVNLSDLGGRKYLRVSIALLLPSEAIAKEVEENKLAMSRLRSAVIEVLTIRTSVQLSTPEGRTELRAAVGESIKAESHLEVKDVLFQEFIVQ